MPEQLMTSECPICKSSVQELARTGDATGYHCPTHGDFKVADTVFAEDKAKGYTREQWEAALEKADERAEPDSWPLIITDDFY
jgi:sarcosine oxidase delta subunit